MTTVMLDMCYAVAYPGIFFWGVCVCVCLCSKNSVEDRENGDLVRGSGGSCNLVQEILFHMVKFS